MDKIFVTGITGLLGTNLVLDLLEKGYRVTGLLRNKKVFENVAHEHFKLLEGNLQDDHTAALKETDIVVHIAAETRQDIIDYENYLKINYAATVHLFHLAAKCKVKKFIYISTANTLEHGSLLHPGTELKLYKKPFSQSLYAKSKWEAENYLLHNNAAIETIILHPTFMLGAFDSKPSSGKIILMAWKKKLIFYPPGGKNLVHVKDVSQAIINAFTMGKHGEKYIIAHENLTYQQFFQRLNIITQQSPLMIKIPKIVLIVCGYCGDLLRRCSVPTGISSVNMKILCEKNFYSNKKSKEKLQISYRPIDVAISDAIKYFERKKLNWK